MQYNGRIAHSARALMQSMYSRNICIAIGFSLLFSTPRTYTCPGSAMSTLHMMTRATCSHQRTD